MITVRKVDVAGRIEELLDRVAAGDEVEIVDGIRPFARLSPATAEAAAGEDEQFVAALTRLRRGLPKDLSLEELLRYRDEERR